MAGRRIFRRRLGRFVTGFTLVATQCPVVIDRCIASRSRAVIAIDGGWCDMSESDYRVPDFVSGARGGARTGMGHFDAPMDFMFIQAFWARLVPRNEGEEWASFGRITAWLAGFARLV